MTSRIISLLLFCPSGLLLPLAANLSGQEQPAPERPDLQVHAVTATGTLMQRALNDGSAESYVLVSELLDGSITAALNDTRKFRVIRSKPEGAFPADVRQIRLEPKLDDFQDYERKVNLAGLGEVIEKRTVRIGLIGTLYDLRTGELLASAAIRLSDTETTVREIARPEEGPKSRALLTKVADEAARQLVSRTLDCLSPPRVIAKTGVQITFNRGKDFGYPVGELLEVFALGEALKDPETGAPLGTEEVLVGLARVIRVNNRVSIAQVVDDRGIEKMCVIRPAEKNVVEGSE